MREIMRKIMKERKKMVVVELMEQEERHRKWCV